MSSDPDPALALQGISWLVRKAVGLSSVTLEVKQYLGPANPTNDESAPLPSEAAGEEAQWTHIDITQIATAGLRGGTEARCLDWRFREVSDWMFGKVRGRSRWIDAASDPVVTGKAVGAAGNDDGENEAWLRKGWLGGAAEAGGPSGEPNVISYVESVDNGWVATQVWGFQLVEVKQGDAVAQERRHCRNVVVTKGKDVVRIRLVYDWVPPAGDGTGTAGDDDDLAY